VAEACLIAVSPINGLTRPATISGALAQSVRRSLLESLCIQREQEFQLDFPVTQLAITARTVRRLTVKRAFEGSTTKARLIDKLKSYDEWLRTTPEEIKGTRRTFGDPKVFYDKFAAELRALCADRKLN
jgi:hypothetical protein